MIPAKATAALMLLVSSSYCALADMPGADWMKSEQVIAKLRASGYTEVTRIEADDGHWEGKGIKNGQKMEFHADPRTGTILSEQPDH